MRASADPGQRMLAALRFVQGQIRYLGVEIGAGSHAPSAPAVVLQRRFGDCKDKSLLAVTMLRSLGIDAEPALVNTNARRGIAGWLATPSAFDHVIARAHVKGATIGSIPHARRSTAALRRCINPTTATPS